VDSPKVQAALGSTLYLHSGRDASPREAVEMYPSMSWFSLLNGVGGGLFPCVPAHRRVSDSGVLWRIENWRSHEIHAHREQADPNFRPRGFVGLRHSAYEDVRRSTGFVVGARALEEAAARSRGS
jgi:hypothetical protein